MFGIRIGRRSVNIDGHKLTVVRMGPRYRGPNEDIYIESGYVPENFHARNCVVGDGVRIGGNVTLEGYVKIGNRVESDYGLTLPDEAEAGDHCVFGGGFNCGDFVNFGLMPKFLDLKPGYGDDCFVECDTALLGEEEYESYLACERNGKRVVTMFLDEYLEISPVLELRMGKIDTTEVVSR